MKTANAAVISLLANATSAADVYRAELITITLIGGQVLRYSAEDVPVSYGGNTWVLGPGFKRGSIKEARGVQIGSLALTVWPKSTDLILGVAWPAFANGGGFDGATFKLEYGYAPAAAMAAGIVGTILKFAGRVGPITDASRDEVPITINSWMELLNANAPLNLIQPTCLHALFDAGCGLIASAFATNKTVTGASTPTQTLFSYTNTGPTQPDNYFALGKVVFTSGANNGLVRTIKSFTSTGGIVSLLNALPVAPTVGDTFTLYPGDDKKMATCSAKFSNLGRFRGFPFVPVPEVGL